MLDSTSSSIHDYMQVGLRGADIKGEFDGGITSAVGQLSPAVLGLAGPRRGHGENTRTANPVTVLPVDAGEHRPASASCLGLQPRHFLRTPALPKEIDRWSLTRCERRS
jgi:hypothetical protein